MGSGKDAELEFRFADGHRVILPVNAVRVQVDGGVVVDMRVPLTTSTVQAGVGEWVVEAPVRCPRPGLWATG
jgi:hypothetical protein